MHWASGETEVNPYKSAFICVLMLLAMTARAQEPQEDVLKIKSNLVNIDVIAKDKKGKYISDLKPEDFIITENGVPQKIEFFDAPLSRKPGEAVVGAPAAETAAPRNYVSLVLDYQTTDITNLKQVREGAIKYVREQVTDSDVVAVLSVTNGLQMLQSLTQDKAQLIAALEKNRRHCGFKKLRTEGSERKHQLASRLVKQRITARIYHESCRRGGGRARDDHAARVATVHHSSHCSEFATVAPDSRRARCFG